MALSGRCRYHPDRDGVGICMRCRAVICTECSTRIEGINHCRRCLEALRGEARAPRRPLAAGPVRAVALGILFLAAFALIVLLTMWRAERP